MGRYSMRFSGYKGRAEAAFTCPACGKAKRKRSFSVEHTVNPFNTNADGSVRTPAEVSRGAQEAAALAKQQFLTEPLCVSCEDALPLTERIALGRRRRQGVPA